MQKIDYESNLCNLRPNPIDCGVQNHKFQIHISNKKYFIKNNKKNGLFYTFLFYITVGIVDLWKQHKFGFTFHGVFLHYSHK